MTKFFSVLALAAVVLFPVSAAAATNGVDPEIVAASGNTARTRPVERSAKPVAAKLTKRAPLRLAYLEQGKYSTVEQLLASLR
jgi:hypothetical protein